MLCNGWTELRPGLVLAGVDDLTVRHRNNPGGDPIAKALMGRPPGATILLSHTPWQAKRVAKTGEGLATPTEGRSAILIMITIHNVLIDLG